MKLDAVDLTARAKDEWIKVEVRKAVRDLDEVLSWMRPKGDVGAPTVLLIADVAISAAAGRLKAITEVLATYGGQAAETIWVSRYGRRSLNRVPAVKRTAAE